MLLYFIIISVGLFMVWFILNLEEKFKDLELFFLGFILVGGIWLMLGLMPAITHTACTKVSLAENYQISKVNPHYYIIVVGDDKIDIKDSFTISKILKKEFKIKKHQHYNIFEYETTNPTYFVIPTYKDH